MPWSEIALPSILLAIKVALKLLVDRSPTFPDVITAFLALPVDIIFLSASLLAAHAISSQHNTKEGIALYACFFLIALFNVAMWRRSEKQFIKDKQVSASLLGIVNVTVAFTSLLYSLSLLSAGSAK